MLSNQDIFLEINVAVEFFQMLFFFFFFFFNYSFSDLGVTAGSVCVAKHKNSLLQIEVLH